MDWLPVEALAHYSWQPIPKNIYTYWQKKWMNLRHDTCKISHAYAYRGVQILDYKTYFCAFIPQKLNKLRRLFFIFPITFAVVSEPGKISHLGVKVRGYGAPKKLPEARILKFSLFLHAYCGQKVDMELHWCLYFVQLWGVGHATSEKVSHFL